MSDVLLINMNVREVQCHLCGQWTEYCWGVPTFNGDVVSNDFPDWLWREGGGSQAVCKACHDAHANGEVKTCDRYYMHLTRTFIGGDGI